MFIVFRSPGMATRRKVWLDGNDYIAAAYHRDRFAFQDGRTAGRTSGNSPFSTPEIKVRVGAEMDGKMIMNEPGIVVATARTNEGKASQTFNSASGGCSTRTAGLMMMGVPEARGSENNQI